MNIRYEDAVKLCERLYEEHQTLFNSERCVRVVAKTGFRSPEVTLYELHTFRKPDNIAQCASYAEVLSRDISLMRKQAVRVHDESDAETQKQLREASHILYDTTKSKPAPQTLLSILSKWWSKS